MASRNAAGRWIVPLALAATILGSGGLSARGQEGPEPGPASIAGATEERLLISVEYRPEGGMKVVAVDPQSPTLQLKPARDPSQTAMLIAGDVITHVNGVEIDSPFTYARALARTPGRAVLTIIDRASGTTEDWLAETVPVQQRLGLFVTFRPEGGALVQSVTPESPARVLRSASNPNFVAAIVPGDVITHVNDQAVASPDSYSRALNSTPGSVTLRIIDGASGQVGDWVSQTLAVRVPREGTGARRSAYVLLVGLTNDPNIGASIKASLEYLEPIFKNEVAEERLRLSVIQGDECTAANLLARVRDVPCGPDDTFLVYYLGHGAHAPTADPRDPSQGHFFSMPGGDLYRITLADAIRDKPGRLKILFSDTCNVQATPVSPARAVSEVALRRIVGLTPLEKLLFNHRGSLDVSASSRGQYSWFSLPFGGWFTYNFANLIARFEAWPPFLGTLSARTDEFYQTKRDAILRNPGATRPDVLASLTNQAQLVPAVFVDDLLDDVAAADANDQRVREIPEVVVRFIE
ncbi:caspase family protein [Planctomyces sp. SH-PL62]|uniref:caspase family protein n=1 Tax=Planctomyces sp. SH-PL62 TaxID=1636152 RepID=UPI0018D2D69A|nr:caspase family protein [Planctomyces sp. SH-PL62]